MTPSFGTLTQAQALTIWAAARERAREFLSAEAVRLAGQGHLEEALRHRGAACILQIRAVQERAQAAVCRAAMTKEVERGDRLSLSGSEHPISIESVLSGVQAGSSLERPGVVQ